MEENGAGKFFTFYFSLVNEYSRFYANEMFCDVINNYAMCVCFFFFSTYIVMYILV